MLKYYNTDITFAEVPDEISLIINFTGCPIRCKGCHSPWLWDNRKGKEFNEQVLKKMIYDAGGISCVCFMGGDQDPEYVSGLALLIHNDYNDKLKVAWYSGCERDPRDFIDFDYIKIGPYIKELGPLNKVGTNQRMFQIIKKRNSQPNIIDITYKFWK